jgi:hypothetical protein
MLLRTEGIRVLLRSYDRCVKDVRSMIAVCCEMRERSMRAYDFVERMIVQYAAPGVC